MSLLAALKLPAPLANNAARPGVVRRAERAAKFRKGDRRAVLEAAIDMAARSDSNSLQDLDAVVFDDANEKMTAVSTMAPRRAYDELEGKGEDKYLAGRIDLRQQVQVDRGVADPVTGRPPPLAFDVSTIVEKRELGKARIGKGERLYERDGEGSLRKPDGFTSPETLVMVHEHLHLLISAHVSKRLGEFAGKAFGGAKLAGTAETDLQKLLIDMAVEATDEVDRYLDRVTIPDGLEEIGSAEELAKQLLKDGTLESRARTALLKVVRKHSKKLAAFREL
ncbi:MAG: hypothetical protein ABIQ06_15115 [Caldimonas sp.]